MDSLVSVIIPVYNVRKYLDECVQSVIMQTYKNLEIILVDDGSTDGSEKLCDDYITKDSRIRVLHKENGGLSDARNEGYKISKGDYISFIDSDDYISPIFIEELLTNLIQLKADIVALRSGTDFWDGESLPNLNTQKIKKGKLVCARRALEEQLCQVNATGAPFKLYKREIVDGVLFPKGYLYEDVATTYKFFMKSNQAVIVTDDLYAYRKRANSIIRRDFKDDKMICLTIADQVINDVKEYDSKLKKEAISRVYAMVYSVFLQVPAGDKRHQKQLWDWMKKYRFSVATNRNPLVRKKNRYGAIASYLGKNMARYLGHKFGQKASMKK